MRQGFTLLELSIVLVIIGLIVGGIMTGQTLIRSAELRSVSKEFDQYRTAINIFKDKYGGLPGDITNATFFFGSSFGGSSINNGDGDRRVADQAGASNGPAEFAQFWLQLAAAGLIKGQFTGTESNGFTDNHGRGATYSRMYCKIDAACPRSNLVNGGWGIGTGYNFTDGRNHFFFGADSSVYGPLYSVLSPLDAANIDSKMDDGLPMSGLIRGYSRNTSNCYSSDTIPVYQVADASIQCALQSIDPF